MRFKYLASLLLLTFGASAAETTRATFGIYRSTDDGRSWSPAGRGLPAELRVDALGHSGDVRLAGTERGLYLSADDGTTWTRPERGVPESVKVFDFATHGDRVYSATSRGVWVSADHGHSWTPAEAELASVRVLSLAVANGSVFAGTDLKGVRVLRAGQTNWEYISMGLPAGAQIFQFSAQDGEVFAALYAQGVYRYDATAMKWISTAKERPLRLVSAGGVLFAGRNPGGVFTSRDGGSSWTNASLGLPANAPTWSLVSRGNTVLLGTSGHSGLLRTDNAGALWTPSDLGLPPDGAAIAFGVTEKSILAAVISGQSGGPVVGTTPGLFPQ